MTLAKAVITVTESPMTMAGSNCEVTARAEQMPSTCVTTGLFRLRGPVSTSLFADEKRLIILSAC